MPGGSRMGVPTLHASTTLPRRRRFPLRWLLLLPAAALLFCLFHPPVFLFCVRQVLLFEARARGASLEIGGMTGSILEPVSLHDVTLVSKTPVGTKLRLAFSRLEAVVKWWDVARGSAFINRMTADGVNAEIDIPLQPGSENPAALRAEERRETGRWLAALMPENLDVSRATLSVRMGDSETAFTNVRFTASEVAPGVVEIERIDLREPWLVKTFSGVRGTTALHGSRLSLGALKLEDGVRIDALSADLGGLPMGKTVVGFSVSAFGGMIRGDVLLAPSNGRVNFEASGSFSQISLEDVARFVESREPAGGVIKEGKFTFRGSPREIDKATIWVWLEATDFLWGKRRWNSLVAGATMYNRQLRIPECRLQQSHNELTLKGEIAIPPAGREWWRSQFDFDISAKIDNLTELSALFGPGFEESAGQMTIDGSVKGRNESFDGELTVAGRRLSYGSAPLDVLKAEIKLNGNELNFSSIEFSHKNDFLRGKGVVNILGEKRYWGQLNASVADLSLYSAFFVRPVAPQPFAGGLFLDWSGDGTAKAHSGAFRAQLKNLRPLAGNDPKFHPLDANVEGTYAPENIFFSRFSVADAETSFDAKVAASPSTVTLQAMKVRHKGDVWLDGDAVLPVSVWNLWQARPWAEVIDFKGPLKVNVNADGLRLHDVALLTGHDFPIKGEVEIKQLAASGSLSDLTATGGVRLRKGEAASFSNIDANIALQGRDAAVQKLAARLDSPIISSGALNADGRIDWKGVGDTRLEIAVRGRAVSANPNPLFHVTTDVDLKVEGPFDSLRVSGFSRILRVDWESRLDLAALLSPDKPLVQPAALSFGPAGRLQISCLGSAPFKMLDASGSATFDLQLTGPASAPVLTGRLGIASVASAPPKEPAIETGAVYFENPNPLDPFLFLQCKGGTFIIGPLSRRHAVLAGEPAAEASLLDAARPAVSLDKMYVPPLPGTTLNE